MDALAAAALSYDYSEGPKLVSESLFCLFLYKEVVERCLEPKLRTFVISHF